MATNKRKDAAALFELIDKSTLKVPKHAGALKIPDWWSSKTNPATTESANGNGVTADGAAKPIARTVTPAKTSPTPAAGAPAPTPATENRATPRLFEPPAEGSSSVSPSIRPPMPQGTGRPVPPPTPPSAPSVPVESAPLRVTEPISESEIAEEPGVTRRMPTTAAQATATARLASDWANGGSRRSMRRPPWAVPAMIGFVVLVVILLIVLISMFRHRKGGSSAGTSTATEVQSDNGTSSPEANAGGGLLPPPGQHPAMPAPGNSGMGMSPGENDNGTAGNSSAGGDADTGIAPGTVGKVYGPGTVQRSADQYYVMISSSPSPTVAQKNADFLAQHGVDVSIEVVAAPGTKNNRWYKLISVKGFASMVAAEPFRKQIVQIGHMHPDFKKYKKVWDDAFVTRVTAVK